MSELLTTLAKITAPPCANAADPTHQNGLIFRVAHSLTSGYATAANIPKAARGRGWDLLSVGANVQWGFLLADSRDAVNQVTPPTPPTLVYGQLSVTGTGHLAAAPTLLDSQPRTFWCPDNALRVVFISNLAPAAPAAFFEAWVSSGRAGRY